MWFCHIGNWMAQMFTIDTNYYCILNTPLQQQSIEIIQNMSLCINITVIFNNLTFSFKAKRSTTIVHEMLISEATPPSLKPKLMSFSLQMMHKDLILSSCGIISLSFAQWCNVSNYVNSISFLKINKLNRFIFYQELGAAITYLMILLQFKINSVGWD